MSAIDGAIGEAAHAIHSAEAKLDHRTEQQYARYNEWRRQIRGCRLVVIEIGAGTAVPTVRVECESAGGTLIRINPHEAEAIGGALSLADKGLQTLIAIQGEIAKRSHHRAWVSAN